MQIGPKPTSLSVPPLSRSASVTFIPPTPRTSTPPVEAPTPSKVESTTPTRTQEETISEKILSTPSSEMQIADRIVSESDEIDASLKGTIKGEMMDLLQKAVFKNALPEDISQAPTFDLICLAKNPLASRQDKAMSELFRYHCHLEYSNENVAATEDIKAMTELAKKDPRSTELTKAFSAFLDKYTKSQVFNIPDVVSKDAKKTLSGLAAAKSAFAAEPSETNRIALDRAHAKVIKNIVDMQTEAKRLLFDTKVRFQPKELEKKLTQAKALLDKYSGRYGSFLLKQKVKALKKEKDYRGAQDLQESLKKARADFKNYEDFRINILGKLTRSERAKAACSSALAAVKAKFL